MLKIKILVLICTMSFSLIIKALEYKSNFKQIFEDKINLLYKESGLQGDFIIGIVDTSGLIYSFAINNKLLDGKISQLNNETPLYIASHSKALTGTLLKVLEGEGIVDLNKTLYDYLPELTFNGKIDTKKIKVRQLLNHTAGFTSTMYTFKTAYLGYTGGNKELIQALNSNISKAPLGEFRYSNTGPNIAGMIVEKVTGNSWKKEMTKRIFNPLGMVKTSSNVSSYNRKDILPAIRTDKQNKIYRSGFYKIDKTMSPAGGTISTINDLSKWLQFNINQDISIIKNKNSFVELHQSTTKQKRNYFTYKRYGYSLGWDIAKYQNHTILTRFGGYAGIGIHLSFIPSMKIGIIAVSNERGTSKLPHLAANYIYNLFSKNGNIEEQFSKEKRLFLDGYNREKSNSLSNDMKITHSNSNDQFIGVYRNIDGWPDVIIKRKDNNYLLSWGEIEGTIFRTKQADHVYIAELGATDRKIRFQIKEGKVFGLVNGSLKFEKFTKQ